MFDCLRLLHCYRVFVAFVLCLPYCCGASVWINPGPVVSKVENVAGFELKGLKAMIQDRSGFMWLATSNGLLRFDGQSIKPFVFDANNSNSLPHNDVRDLIEDQQGYLWIITRGGGLSRFNPHTEQFDNFSHQADDLR